jgi:hypothetical protein
MQFAIILLLIAIVTSLGQALAVMAAGPDQSARMARALTMRISLSLGLFVLLFVGYHLGWIEPHQAF